jgi:hypothetical protein
MIDAQLITHAKRAELLSSFGAGVLGMGIGLWLANVLAGYAIPILLLGLISHSLGMFQKHQLEQGRYVRIVWVESVYWLCWLALAVLLVYIVIRQF